MISWPQIPHLSRQYMLDVLDLSFADTVCKHREDCPSHPLGIDTFIAPELLLDPSQELLFMPLFQRLASRIPAFVVEATDQHRELRSELRYLLYREPVAQR